MLRRPAHILIFAIYSFLALATAWPLRGEDGETDLRLETVKDKGTDGETDLRLETVKDKGAGKGVDWHVNFRGRVGLATQNEDFQAKCDFLRVSVYGTFGEHFSFRVRQRFNKPITDGNFLSATDYLWVSWRKNDWEILGGKCYVACGGFEYLASSYDIYIRPIFYEGLGGMYNYVIQGTRYFKNESLCIQVSNSLYSPRASKLLGYSALLRGRQGPWEHGWSVNLFEREKGKYNFYVCLGNRFHILERATIDVGLTHRFDIARPTAFKDFSAVTKFRVHALGWLDVLGKATWDYKEAGIEDPMLPDGTDIWQAGGGLEFFPVKNAHLLRLHLFYYTQNGNRHCLLAGLGLDLNLR